MQILSSENANVLAELLLEDLPRAVLDLICQTPTISEGALIGTITKQLPSSISEKAVRDRCIDSIRWFLHNGDIMTSGDRRYVVTPPYLVMQEKTKLKLCGDPRLDFKVGAVLKKLGGYLETKYVPWYWRIETEQDIPNVGIKRICHVPSNPLEEIRDNFSNLDIPILYTENFETKLPSINAIVRPPRSAFTVLPPNWGYWDLYAARLVGDIRWIAIDHWSNETHGLLRWLSSRDARGKYGARFFLHNGFDRLAEINQSHARLWMMNLDHHAGFPQMVWIKGRDIWVPTEIPDPHQHWLQLISEDWYREGQYRRYILARDPEPVSKKLKETLGLQIVSGQPD